MLEQYPAIYQDASGEEQTTILNDGKMLRMIVRGVEFAGEGFDWMEPVNLIDETQLAGFTLCAGYLCTCTISCDMPLPVVAGNEAFLGQLHIQIELGAPRTGGNAGISREDLTFSLSLGSYIFTDKRVWDEFESGLNALQEMLPEGTYIKSCINCAFSDYSPFGHGLFGYLACFRDQKEAYRAVGGKRDLFRLWDKKTEYVQETYLCPEFERRTPDTGYRG